MTQNNTSRREKNPQFVTINLDDAIARFKNRELTIKGLVRLYFEIHLYPGSEMDYSPSNIAAELNISKSSVYEAVGQLQKEGLLTVTPSKYLVVTKGGQQ